MIGNAIKVLNKNIIASLVKFTGIFEAKMTPPTSLKKMSCTILKAATINLVISLWTDSIIKAGKNISVKPTKIVSDAAFASGTWKSSNNGTKGVPSHVKSGVVSATINPSVPIAITTGSTPTHMSSTFFTAILCIE